MEISCFACLSPPLGAEGPCTMIILGSLERTISINWPFFARCYGWSATSEYWLKIGDFAPTGASWLKISGRRGAPHQPFFFSET